MARWERLRFFHWLIMPNSQNDYIIRVILCQHCVSILTSEWVCDLCIITPSHYVCQSFWNWERLGTLGYFHAKYTTRIKGVLDIPRSRRNMMFYCMMICVMICMIVPPRCPIKTKLLLVHSIPQPIIPRVPCFRLFKIDIIVYKAVGHRVISFEWRRRLRMVKIC